LILTALKRVRLKSGRDKLPSPVEKMEVSSRSNYDLQGVIRIKHAGYHFKISLFQNYLGLVTANLHILFGAVQPLQNGSGRLFFGDGSDDPLQACLEAVLGWRDISHL
jgi:hypothetical protein